LIVQKRCVSKLERHIASGKVYVRNEAAKQKLHAVGHDLFQGDTPVGKGLNSINGTPGHDLGSNVFTSGDVFNLPENVEGTIITSIHDTGWSEIIHHILDSGPELNLDFISKTLIYVSGNRRNS
jgi:hypothetical protein